MVAPQGWICKKTENGIELVSETQTAIFCWLILSYLILAMGERYLEGVYRRRIVLERIGSTVYGPDRLTRVNWMKLRWSAAIVRRTVRGHLAASNSNLLLLYSLHDICYVIFCQLWHSSSRQEWRRWSRAEWMTELDGNYCGDVANLLQLLLQLGKIVTWQGNIKAAHCHGFSAIPIPVENHRVVISYSSWNLWFGEPTTVETRLVSSSLHYMFNISLQC